MNQNKNVFYHAESTLPSSLQQNMGISVFSIATNNEEEIRRGQEIRRNSFRIFINSRNNYLSNLKNLGDNWISGESKQPTDESIKLSKDILNDIGNWYINVGYENFIYPKIIMGPTPCGGVGIEIEIFPNKKAYVNVLDKEVEFEIERDGFFAEYSSNRIDIRDQILTLFNSNERRYNSEWRIPI